MEESQAFNNITFNLPKHKSAEIKVIGVGGGGSNAVNYMYEQGITGVDFVISNTDAQALQTSPVPNKVQLGASVTEGLGAGADPEVGEQAALESMDDIKSLLDTHTKMLFITAGMGGGTGTGAAPVIAKCAKEMGILTVGICTAPFSFEGKRRLEQAKKGIDKMRDSVDSLIIINNDKLRELYGNLGYKSGFAKADEVLATAAKGIAEVITHHYTANIDLRDARTVLENSGTAIMGSAKASGEGKAQKAIKSALDSPLLNDNKITGAKNVLLLIVSGNDEVTMDEIGEVNDFIQKEARNDTNIIMGVGEDENLGDEMSVTIIATGFPADQQDYTNKEKKIVIHSLDDEATKQKEKPLVQEVEAPQMIQKKEEIFETSIEEEVVEKKEKVLLLDLEEEPEDDFFIEPTSKETIQEEEVQPLVEEVQTQEKKFEKETATQPMSLFSLEDEDEEMDQELHSINQSVSTKLEDVVPTVEEKETTVIDEVERKEETETERPIENFSSESPFNEPISGAMQKQIEERRNRLKKYNFKFNSSKLEATNEPAFRKQGIDLHEFKHEKPSGLYLDETDGKDIKIRPNNFLHDNVD